VRLTNSQKANLAALLVGLGSIIADNTASVEQAFPAVHWLSPALAFASLLITSVARSLATSNSGTGGGVLNSGPDLKATPTPPPPPAEP
jgi:hypothetical protein